MAIFDDSIPANSEALKLGAKDIRDIKTTLNSLLGTLFEDNGDPKNNTVTTAEITDLAVTTAKLAALAVTAAKIAAGAVETAKLADNVLHSDTYQTAGPLVISQVYRIRSLAGSDSFLDVGAVLNEVGEIFVATGTTPAVWSSGSSVSTPDAVGLAKMQDKFVKTAKLEDASVTEDKLADEAVTTDKIEDGVITEAKLDDSVGIARALARWSGAAYQRRIISKTVAVANRLTLTTNINGVFPIAGSGVTLQNAPCGIVVYNVTADDSTDPVNTNVRFGHLYYIYAIDTTHISLHTSPQGAIDGTTNIVTFAANFTQVNTYYFKFLNPSLVFKRGCDIVPIVSSSSFSKTHGYRVYWRTPWADALNGILQVEQQYDTATNSNASVVLRPSVIASEKADFCYISSGTNDWKNASSDYDDTDIQTMTGSNMVTAFL